MKILYLLCLLATGTGISLGAASCGKHSKISETSYSRYINLLCNDTNAPPIVLKAKFPFGSEVLLKSDGAFSIDGTVLFDDAQRARQMLREVSGLNLFSVSHHELARKIDQSSTYKNRYGYDIAKHRDVVKMVAFELYCDNELIYLFRFPYNAFREERVGFTECVIVRDVMDILTSEISNCRKDHPVKFRL